MTPRRVTADRGDGGRRLDLVLRRHLTDVSAATRTQIQKWIANGRVTVNGSPVCRAAARAAPGDAIVIALPDIEPGRIVVPEDGPLDIIYEDDHLLAVNKPPGVVVHPGFRNNGRTLLNALLGHARRWPDGSRPSIVGRLDKLTSGIVVVAKSAAVHAALQRELASDQGEKTYLALVYGRVNQPRGCIALPLARNPRDRRKVTVSRSTGRPSATRFERLLRVAAPKAGLSLLQCHLLTGRMHQIRVHLAARGWPIVGDRVYGEARWRSIVDPRLAETLSEFPRQALHAWRTSLRHPATGRRVTFEATLPSDFGDLLISTGLSRSDFERPTL